MENVSGAILTLGIILGVMCILMIAFFLFIFLFARAEIRESKKVAVETEQKKHSSPYSRKIIDGSTGEEI